jgi:nitrite reductase/ring-hydroxylating ferredoxin subunit
MVENSKPSVLTREDKIKIGREDSYQYFRYMSGFVGFTQDDADAIRDSGLIVEKYIPEIVARFYTHLLSYPPTREHFINREGKIDQDYLQLRMHHLTNFWRKTAGGKFDADYARYIDYVGRAHTSHGADPNIYIAERYVIGQVGFMQHAITSAITKELHSIDPDLEVRALKAWNLLMMVILELLSRAYSDEHVIETSALPGTINPLEVFYLAVETYEHGLGLQRPVEVQEVVAGMAIDIPEGERKIVQIGDVSIGIFHHKGHWVALKNSCLHRGGPVCTGSLVGDVLTCPWHGFQYNVTNGQFLADPSARLVSYPTEIRDGEIFLTIPKNIRQQFDLSYQEGENIPEEQPLMENEFRLTDILPGKMKLVSLARQPVTVYNVSGEFYATQDACTHADGPLYEGDLEGTTVTCPWHGSCFDVTTGKVLCGPADQPVRTYQVIIQGEKGIVV